MSREIDIIVVKIAGILPLDISVNILNPVIATGEFPANLCALKILTELTQKQGKDLTDNHLDCIMPNVARVSEFEEVVGVIRTTLQVWVIFSARNSSLMIVNRWYGKRQCSVS